MEQIKKDLQLSDTALGFLGGMAFALFYVIVGLPLARISDTGNRKKMIAWCLGVWSAATAMCGLAQNAVQLFFTRIAVASGEGGGGPAIVSLLTELFSKDKRATILAVVSASSSIGIAAGISMGGRLLTNFTWREVFFIIGIPGIIFAFIAYFIVKEPRETQGKVEKLPSIPLKEAWQHIKTSKAIFWATLIIVSNSIVGFGTIIWSPSFLIRVHKIPVSQAGDLSAIAILVGLVLGGLFSGWFSDKIRIKKPQWNGILAFGGPLISLPLVVGFAFVKDTNLAVLLFLVSQFAIVLWYPAVQAIFISEVPSSMRALMSAFWGMLVNLSGTGLGALFIGLLSDFYGPKYGDLSLRYSLITISSLLLISAYSGYQTIKHAKPFTE